MIAYVFWHWKQPGVGAPEYERAQRAFHAAMAASPPAGFHWSQSFAISGCPWAAQGGEAYEDRYLVDDFPALTALESGAVSAPRQAAHDAAAAVAAGGAAGIYELKLGTPMHAPRQAAWFAKPAGVTYAALWTLLDPVVQQTGSAVWMRKMVLGPTPEFCLYSAGPLVLPAPLFPMTVPLRPVWPA